MLVWLSVILFGECWMAEWLVRYKVWAMVLLMAEGMEMG